MLEATKKHLAARKAPRREELTGNYTFPPKEVVLLITPGGTMVETTFGREETRTTAPRRFTAIDIELPNGRHVSIQDLIENYAG